MGLITHTHYDSHTNGGAVLSASNVLAIDAEANISFTAVTGGTGTKKEFQYLPSGLQDVFLEVTGLAAGQSVTLTTYTAVKASQGSALDTITLTQGVPITWLSGGGTCPLQTSTVVNSIKLANATGTTCTVDIRLGMNG